MNPQWHKVWHVGDDVDTDALAPGAYMQHGIDVIAQHCLENVLPDFAAGVKPGDIPIEQATRVELVINRKTVPQFRLRQVV